MSGRLIVGDALHVLQTLPDGTADMVMTSPPYADMRAKQYGGPPPDEYVAWYLPIAAELARVLAPSANYVLVIKEQVVAGERSTYVHDLIAAHRALGFRWAEEYIWAKTAAMPGKFPDRLADAWEHCLHFVNAGDAEPYFDRDSTRRAAAPAATARILRGQARGEKATSISGHQCEYRRFDPYTALATNVIHAAPIRHNVGHPAAYPPAIPRFFIPLMSRPLATVLDPFVGSGTTARVAERLGRRWIGIDRRADYIEVARRNIGPTHVPLDAPPEDEDEAAAAAATARQGPTAKAQSPAATGGAGGPRLSIPIQQDEDHYKHAYNRPHGDRRLPPPL